MQNEKIDLFNLHNSLIISIYAQMPDNHSVTAIVF